LVEDHLVVVLATAEAALDRNPATLRASKP
jgi:hypothetical protein